MTMRNTDVSPLALPKNKPIAGITVHLLDQDYYEEIPISKETLRSYFLSQEIRDDTQNPTDKKKENASQYDSPKQHLKDIQEKLRHATALLEASRLDPPPGC